jgi:hypothetical protein
MALLITFGLILIVMYSVSFNATDFGEGVGYLIMYGAAVWFCITYILPLLGIT